MGSPEISGSFITVLEDAFVRHADRVCTSFRGRDLSYREVDSQSARIADTLIKQGFEKGMKGAVYSLNSDQAFIATIGLIRAGGVWVPINPKNSEQDNVDAMLAFDCRAVFYQGHFAAPARQVIEQSRPAPISVCMDDDGTPATPAEPPLVPGGAAGRKPQLGPQDLISLPLTGGTTGKPKGVMLTHGNFCALDFAARSLTDERTHSVWLCAAPMTHVGGRIALAHMSSGSRFVILERIDVQEILKTIEQQGVTDFFLPPTAIYNLLDQPNLDEFDLSSLRQLGYGSAPISIERLKQALSVLGPIMVGGYGQTECPMYISSLRQDDHFVEGQVAPDHRLRSVGRATPISELGILDDRGNTLPAGETGEIAVKGPMVSLGYYRDPEETARVRLNGWHLTGDIGYLDEGGFLYICDRKKDMIITGGFNVYSTEVEGALMAIPGVEMAVVVGAPSEKWGEEVRAQVKLEAGTSLTPAQIIADAKKRVGSVKAPKLVEIVTDFPRTPLGKLDKKSVRLRLQDKG